MSQEQIVIHGFETSNNMKVRVGLGYKQIPYEFRTIDPADREELVRLSGQRLTPVLQHGSVTLSDSAAILRYLEANFPDTPRMLGNSVAEQWAIEDLELFARTTLAGPMMQVVHTRITTGSVADSTQAQCEADFGAAATALAEKLGDREWLFGDCMTIADVTAAAVLFRIRKAEMFRMPASADAMGPWIDRVMSYDGKCRTA